MFASYQHWKDVILLSSGFWLKVMLLLFQRALKIFLLSLFSNFTLMCLDLVFFVFILKSMCPSWYCDLMSFICLGKFLAIVLSNIASAPLSVISSGCSYTYARLFHSYILFCIYLLLYLHASVWYFLLVCLPFCFLSAMS